jgi:ribosomal protection tetracycline resistance protein
VRTLNLGILAHVDAGKTSLTERLLFAAGVIDEPGRVDDGSTQTDTLALERQRGITIRSAVVSFEVAGLRVNLVDTPGHPDFIAEVERVLGVLDGAVLVVSAVAGVQAQTRVLMRALRRLGLPVLIFINKIDRAGADIGRVLAEITARLTPAIIPMGAVRDPGTRRADVSLHAAADTAFTGLLADVLTGQDEALLAAFVRDEAAVPYGRLRAALAAQARRGLVHPVYAGSAMTGAGIGALMAGLAELLPAADGDPDGPVSGTVFKVDRGPAGEKVAYARLFSGTLRVRDRLAAGRQPAARVTAISVFDRGGAARRDGVTAGQIAQLRGLGDIRIGDALGVPPAGAPARQFALPMMETVAVPARDADRGALRAALAQLAEQDPLISLRQDDTGREIIVSLYGEMQKEVLAATLAADFGLAVRFRATTTICVERLAGAGMAAEVIGVPPNPFPAGVALRAEPGPDGSGVQFRPGTELGSLPLAFLRAVEAAVRETLRRGLHGWRVQDCAVTLTGSGYSAPVSTAGDFRLLTPLVLMSALRQAGTVVHEPVHRFRLEVPADTAPLLLPVLGRLGAAARPPVPLGRECVLEGDIPAARVRELGLELPGLTRGEGILESVFTRYQPVRGPVPSRPGSRPGPLTREQYLLQVARRGQ